MKTILDFDDESTKQLLAKLDFEFFLKQNFEANEYTESDISSIYTNFHQTKELIKSKAKNKKKQFNYYSEGQVRKMFTGNFLPALFGLDETRELTIYNFIDIGESWAYFNYWQNYQKRKITKEVIWSIIIKSGSLLAIILSIIKLLEVLNTQLQ